MEALAKIELKMRQAGARPAAIQSFRRNYLTLVSGATGLIPETAIRPVGELPRQEELPRDLAPETIAGLIARTVVIKLNGGLGTSMGLEWPKSLINVKHGWNFLDFTARQVLHLREKYRAPLRLLFLNSFNTSRDTLEHLRRYPMLATDVPVEFVQSKAPKLRADTLTAVEWPANPELEWCPPGHGDIYPTLLDTGLLDEFARLGIEHLFISNADNLGANLDLGLLAYFAGQGLPFLMEVAERTPSDRKGGHLARAADGGGLLLRESAQCAADDEAAFQDITRHRFFNTNNLWVSVSALRAALDANGGILPLPLMRNVKTVDPTDPASPRVEQLETAMGAAIALFAGAGAMVVSRRRFAPVKTTADLLALRSDAYVVNDDYTLALAAARRGLPPKINLDERHYKIMARFEAAFGAQVPSLVAADVLTVTGAVACAAGVTVSGTVEVVNAGTARQPWPAGVYHNRRVEL
ncbi:MAG: UTP--glucose-1-phosphate uridylyltransferase [Verrucomicrobiales bacterium]|jgi:UDP-N-acetylglucosamine pyrophosphorylase|nr:UTP--glucose-1-phosphate uridylyltransferase [Verrucomicrobiales bacterium]